MKSPLVWNFLIFCFFPLFVDFKLFSSIAWLHEHFLQKFWLLLKNYAALLLVLHNSCLSNNSQNNIVIEWWWRLVGVVLWTTNIPAHNAAMWKHRKHGWRATEDWNGYNAKRVNLNTLRTGTKFWSLCKFWLLLITTF